MKNANKLIAVFSAAAMEIKGQIHIKNPSLGESWNIEKIVF